MLSVSVSEDEGGTFPSFPWTTKEMMMFMQDYAQSHDKNVDAQ
jgi:hypothetical protein